VAADAAVTVAIERAQRRGGVGEFGGGERAIAIDVDGADVGDGSGPSVVEAVRAAAIAAGGVRSGVGFGLCQEGRGGGETESGEDEAGERFHGDRTSDSAADRLTG